MVLRHLPLLTDLLLFQMWIFRNGQSDCDADRMLIGVYVSYLSSISFYSIYLYIDTRQDCATFSSEWIFSTQKNDRKKRKKNKINCS